MNGPSTKCDSREAEWFASRATPVTPGPLLPGLGWACTLQISPALGIPEKIIRGKHLGFSEHLGSLILEIKIVSLVKDFVDDPNFHLVIITVLHQNSQLNTKHAMHDPDTYMNSSLWIEHQKVHLGREGCLCNSMSSRLCNAVSFFSKQVSPRNSG
jgi:hypothetical protein